MNDIWNSVEKIVNHHRIYNDYELESLCEEVIKILDPYLKRCASNFFEDIKRYNLIIPYEDFYSNLLLDVWLGIKEYVQEQLFIDHSIKNILLKRISISKFKTLRKHKKYRIIIDDTFIFKFSNLENQHINNLLLDNIVLEDVVNKSLNELGIYNKNYKQFIIFLMLGYSSKEAYHRWISTNNDSYGSCERKRVQRIKSMFKKILLKHLTNDGRD